MLVRFPFALVVALNVLHFVTSAFTHVVSNPICLEGRPFSKLDQSPCFVAAHLAAACNGGEYTLPALTSEQSYEGPDDGSNPCQCSSVYFLLLSACSFCQGGEAGSWSSWSSKCKWTYLAEFPQPIPSDVVVPPWAFAEIVATDGFNAAAAKHGIPTSTGLASFTTAASSTTVAAVSTTSGPTGETVPATAQPTSSDIAPTSTIPSTDATPPSSPDSQGSSSDGGSGGGSTNVGAIVGAVLGGTAAGFILGFLLLALLCKQFREKVMGLFLWRSNDPGRHRRLSDEESQTEGKTSAVQDGLVVGRNSDEKHDEKQSPASHAHAIPVGPAQQADSTKPQDDYPPDDQSPADVDNNEPPASGEGRKEEHDENDDEHKDSERPSGNQSATARNDDENPAKTSPKRKKGRGDGARRVRLTTRRQEDDEESTSATSDEDDDERDRNKDTRSRRRELPASDDQRFDLSAKSRHRSEGGQDDASSSAADEDGKPTTSRRRKEDSEGRLKHVPEHAASPDKTQPGRKHRDRREVTFESDEHESLSRIESEHSGRSERHSEQKHTSTDRVRLASSSNYDDHERRRAHQAQGKDMNRGERGGTVRDSGYRDRSDVDSTTEDSVKMLIRERHKRSVLADDIQDLAEAAELEENSEEGAGDHSKLATMHSKRGEQSTKSNVEEVKSDTRVSDSLFSSSSGPSEVYKHSASAAVAHSSVDDSKHFVISPPAERTRTTSHSKPGDSEMTAQDIAEASSSQGGKHEGDTVVPSKSEKSEALEHAVSTHQEEQHEGVHTTRATSERWNVRTIKRHRIRTFFTGRR